MKKLRVLFVLGSLEIGGTERQVVEILRFLDRQRFEPYLYLTYRRGELLEQVPDDVCVTSYWDHHRRPRVYFPGWILCSQVRDLRRAIRNQQIDLVYDRASHVAITAGLATPPDVARVSVVVAAPDLDFAHSHPRFRYFKRVSLRRSYRRADRVLAVSAGVREGLLQFHRLPPEQVLTCYNIFDIPRLEQLSQSPGVEFAPERFHIACVGRLQREKGQRVLLAAADLLVHQRGHNEILLWLIGDGPDEPELRREVAERGLEQQVRFEGYCANPLPYVRQAQLFCLPSLFEGMPNALVEAMICRTPVLASDCPSGPREILADGRYGRLVPAGRELELADALDDAIHNLAAWRAKTEAARRHVEATYSVGAGMARLEAVLEQVAAGSP